MAATSRRRQRSVRRQLRRRRRLSVALAVLLLAAGPAGCGGGNGDGEPDELTGLIVDIQGRGNDVRSFTLQSAEGKHEIRIAPDVDYGFPLGHLRAHQGSLLPVRCTLERRQGRLYALQIVDA